MSDAPVIEGEAQDVSTELTVAPASPTTLFRTDNPTQVLERATEVANALSSVIAERKLYENIRGKHHVLVEGWLTCGAMLGVTPVCEWTRALDNGWEARVEARTLDGRVIGAAEAMCLRSEKRWKSADDYAVRSMAQTRATSKALASVLRFIVTLAGYPGTPAEEADEPHVEPAAPAMPETPASAEQVKAIGDALKASELGFSRLSLLIGSVGGESPRINRGDSIVKSVRALRPEQADELLRRLGEEADSE